MITSLIATVLNEESTIKNFLDSILNQSKKPDELVVVDGFSKDRTVEEIRKFQNSNKQIKVKLIVKRGNRSVGRNAAIENSTGDIIAISDAGCTLDKDWLKNITKPFENKKVDVVAGYYKGKAQTVFQESLIPYVLVMEDKVDKDNFLPATRSMAFKKNVWKSVGKFNEKLSHNEDYDFSRRLREKFNIVFEKTAIVYWEPPSTFKKIFIMFYRFAYGDAEAGIYRPKVLLIFLRYLLGAILVCVFFIFRSNIALLLLGFGLVCYIFWSIGKNYKYVKKLPAVIYLPMLQLLSDIAVIFGTKAGTIVKIWK